MHIRATDIYYAQTLIPINMCKYANGNRKIGWTIRMCIFHYRNKNLNWTYYITLHISKLKRNTLAVKWDSTKIGSFHAKYLFLPVFALKSGIWIKNSFCIKITPWNYLFGASEANTEFSWLFSLVHATKPFEMSLQLQRCKWKEYEANGKANISNRKAFFWFLF